MGGSVLTRNTNTNSEVVAVLGRAVGLWWLNCCRIVYVVNEVGLVAKFGFAYGTLPGHVESGEERFQVEWNRNDNTVWYDLLAFSRPKPLLNSNRLSCGASNPKTVWQGFRNSDAKSNCTIALHGFIT